MGIEKMEMYNKKDWRTVQKANGCVGYEEAEASFLSIQLSAVQANLHPLFAASHTSTGGRVSSNSHYPSNLHSTGKNSKQQLENKKEVWNKTILFETTERSNQIMLELCSPTLPTYCMSQSS